MTKLPFSVLVLVYAENSRRVLMLQRCDDPSFWQSVTGSLERGETPEQAAIREVYEELNINILAEGMQLIDTGREVEFEIFHHFRHRYAADITHNREHWFTLTLPAERVVTLSEHLSYCWLSAPEAAGLTKSWSNRQAIEEFVLSP